MVRLVRSVSLAVLLWNALAGAPAVAQKVTAEPNISSGVAVSLGDCATRQLADRDIVSSVLTALVTKGVNVLGAALTAAGQDKTWKVTGSRNLDLSGAPAKPFPKCIQIVRGKFRTDQAAGTAPDWASQLGLLGTGWATLNTNGLWLADKPDFFFEGALVTSGDKGAISIRPLFAVLNQSQGERAFRGKERGVALIFAFSAAGTSANLETNPSATIAIGSMVPGQALKFPTAAAPSGSLPYDSPWFVLSEADARKPMTVTAMVSETQAGSPFFAFLASIFNDDSVKKAITDKATVLVVPSAGAAAQAATAQTQQTALATAETKMGAALDALATCKATAIDGVVAKAVLAKAALREYLAADLAAPSPVKKVTEAVISGIDLYKPSELSGKCAAAYKTITGEELP